MALRELDKQTEQPVLFHSFLETIGRPDLVMRITQETPYCYFSPEFGLDTIGPNKAKLAAAGGLGILSADHMLQTSLTGLPVDAFGIYHTIKLQSHIDRSNWQYETCTVAPTPDELGLSMNQDLQIAVAANGDTVHLKVYDLDIGGATTLHMLYEDGLREVYPGQPTDDHRLYQMAVLGFGGWQVLQQLGKTPSILHLNESSTVLSALAMWDSIMQQNLNQGMTDEEAFARSLAEVRSKTILTNHTLVPAAEAEYSLYQYENYVAKNIQNPLIKECLRTLITTKNGRMRILDLGLHLSGRFNGVSQLHASLASGVFQTMYSDQLEGERPMTFEGITNAIDYRWYEETHAIYRELGIQDEFDLPAQDYRDRIVKIGTRRLRAAKNRSKTKLRKFLRQRELGNNEVDTLGKKRILELPDDAVVIGWARRFAEYKRPGMLLADIPKLKELLMAYPQAHIVYAGKTHPTDTPMKIELQRILGIIQTDEVLKSRLHFIQDYDIEAGKALTAGADIWLNTPCVGAEACGTSIFKAVANNAILISTPDGGAADVPIDSYLAIKGPDEVSSLYQKLDEALALVEEPDQWGDYVRKQLIEFFPTICGGRMVADYLKFAFPTFD